MDKIEIINQWKLQRVFEELENGNMRIPRFQRAYVWERAKIVKLLNSIFHEYPIGSFFLWETDSSMETFGRNLSDLGLPAKPEGKYFRFILDGQQRITSLYVTLKGKSINDTNYAKICFNLDKKIFKIPQLKTEQHNIPVCKIWDPIEYSKLFMEYAQKGDMEHMEALQECQKQLLNYPISIIMSRNMGLNEVVEIFERINQGGKRLSLFDLVHASVWAEDFDLREKIEAFNSETAISLWGKLGAEVFTQSLALNIKNDCTKLVQLKLTSEECKKVWEKTLECIRIAIDYVKTLGVLRLSFLPYSSMIPLIQYYLYRGQYNGIQPQDSQLIKDWFWTATFSTRYSASTLTRMNEDADWIERVIDGRAEPRIFAISLKAEDLKRVRMDTSSVIKNGILCLMTQRKPVDFDNGQLVSVDNTNASRSNAKENHHFFPYSLAKTFGVSVNEINSVLNFAFISKRLNGAISNSKPSIYLKTYSETVPELEKYLETHFISSLSYEAAMKDDFNTFIAERGKIIMSQINNVCQIKNPNTITMIEDDDVEDGLVDEDIDKEI